MGYCVKARIKVKGNEPSTVEWHRQDLGQEEAATLVAGLLETGEYEQVWAEMEVQAKVVVDFSFDDVLHDALNDESLYADLEEIEDAAKRLGARYARKKKLFAEWARKYLAFAERGKVEIDFVTGSARLLERSEWPR